MKNQKFVRNSANICRFGTDATATGHIIITNTAHIQLPLLTMHRDGSA